MLRPRVIPCLLIKNHGLVKTVNFGRPQYVGDPINVVRIFNEKQVDELIVLDIDATAQGREPDYRVIEHLAAECNMPLCYGGGVRTSEQIRRIIGLGVEKVAVSSGAVRDPTIVSQAAHSVGSQSIVVVLDVRKHPTDSSYEVFTHNGSRATGLDPAECARRMESAGAGEIVVNSIDNDGRMKGYDMALIERVRRSITTPLTCLGGAGSLQDITALVQAFGTIGAAAGSLFVFKGVYRAVLVNYPSQSFKDSLVNVATQ